MAFMSDQIIIENCSPTLAGLKTGNLFSCQYENKDEDLCEVRRLNRFLCKKGIRIVPVKYYESRVVLYIYRPKALYRDLNDERANAVLTGLGYRTECTEGCVAFLGKKMREKTCREDFPHEVGFFLGYPPTDVIGFMNHPYDCKCVGCWKVYGDVHKAVKTFDQYKACTREYLRRYKMGASLEQLAIG